MPRPLVPGGRTRLNLAISPEVKARLENLQERTEADSMTEVIRRALAVYERLVDIDRDGCVFRIEGPEGDDRGRLRIWPV